MHCDARLKAIFFGCEWNSISTSQPPPNTSRRVHTPQNSADRLLETGVGATSSAGQSLLRLQSGPRSGGSKTGPCSSLSIRRLIAGGDAAPAFIKTAARAVIWLAKQGCSIDQPNCVGSVTFMSDRFQTCNFSVTGRISGGGELEKGFRLRLFRAGVSIFRMCEFWALQANKKQNKSNSGNYSNENSI
jgi:hypothetical protein